MGYSVRENRPEGQGACLDRCGTVDRLLGGQRTAIAIAGGCGDPRVLDCVAGEGKIGYSIKKSGREAETR
jgi:hypothetical protein